MKDFILLNVDRIGQVNIHLEVQDWNDIVEMADTWEIEEIVVSSLRIDVVLARALNVSRNRAKIMIQEKRIKINWIEIDRPDIEVEEHDIISVRGHGRLQIRKSLGTTRKDNLIVEVGIIDRNN